MQCKYAGIYVISGPSGMNTYIKHLRPVNLVLLGLLQTWLYLYLFTHHNVERVVLIPALVSIVLIIVAASGYVINDIYDVISDAANNRASVLQIKFPKRLWLLYSALVTAGFILSFYIASQLHAIQWLLLYPLSIIGLWLYSRNLKCIALIGNLWVSFFAAGVFILPFLTMYLVTSEWWVDKTIQLFILFCFLSTLYREIIKDLQDIPGDEKANCKTLPLVLGEMHARSIALVVGIIEAMALLVWVLYEPGLKLKLGLIGLLLLLIGAITLTYKAQLAQQYKNVSTILKFIMYGGAILLTLS